MKKILSLLLALLMLGSMVACTGDDTPDTTEDTTGDVLEGGEETVEDTADETVMEEVLGIVSDSRFAQAKKASLIYMLDTTCNTKSERLLVSSVQGLAAKLSDVQILCPGPSVDIMIDQIERVWGVPVEETMNGETVTVATMLQYYYDNGTLSQYVLCDVDNKDSYYVAASLAGVLNVVVATQETKAMLDDMGYTCLIDVSDKTDAWLRQSEYWSLFSKTVAFEPTWDIDLFDYGVLTGGYINYYDGYEPDPHREIFEFLDDNAVVFGWNSTLGEMHTVQSLASANITLIPSGSNLSTLSGFRLESAKQKRNYDDGTDVEDAHTVTFIYTDGDNVGYIMNGMQWDSLYKSPLRGSFDLGWSVPANMLETIPPLAAYLYESMTERDEFLVALGSIGYTYPSRWSKEARAAMTEEVAGFMKRTDLRYMLILDDLAWNEELLADYTEHEGIDGLFYVGFDVQAGRVLWSNGKPVVGCRKDLYHGYDGQYKSILTWLSRDTLSTDPKKTRSYSMYYVNCWSVSMDVLNTLISELPDTVDVVTPSEFMDRMVANCKPDDQ